MKKIVSLILVTILIISTSSLSFAQGNVPSEWAKESVDELKKTSDFKNSIFSAYSTNISRGDFIYLAVKVYEMLNYNEIKIDTSIKFSDTDEKYVLKAASLGITDGIGQGKFGHDKDLTREELAVLMTKTIKIMGRELEEADTYRFKDEESFSSWAKESIYIAKKNGIINGIGNDKFDAKGKANKEQAIAIIYNTLRKYGHGQFTFANTKGSGSSDSSIMPNIESIKNKYKEDLTFYFSKDSVTINSKDDTKNIFSFYENYWSGSIDISNQITSDAVENQVRDEIYSELLGKEEYNYINDAINVSKKAADTLYTTPSGKYEFIYSDILVAPVVNHRYRLIKIRPIAVGFKEIKYSPEDSEYWKDFAESDDVKKILKTLPEGTKVYNSIRLIKVGSDHYLNRGYLEISTHENFDDVKFNITGWSQAGVQSSLKQFLNLWTDDGDEIFNGIVAAFDGKDGPADNKWAVASNGTEYFFTGEGIGVTIRVRK